MRKSIKDCEPFGQDVSIVECERVSTHIPLCLITVRISGGHICETPVVPNVLHLIPSSAREVAAALLKAADRAEVKAQEYLDRNRTENEPPPSDESERLVPRRG